MLPTLMEFWNSLNLHFTIQLKMKKFHVHVESVIIALWLNKEDIYDHLICDSFDESYVDWVYHGEASPSNGVDETCKLDDMHVLINDIAGPLNDHEMMDDESGEMLGEDFSKYYDLLKNAKWSYILVVRSSQIVIHCSSLSY